MAKFEQFNVETQRFIFRKPYSRKQGKKKFWKVRRREKATGVVAQLTLKAESFEEAKQEVHELAFKETEKAVGEGTAVVTGDNPKAAKSSVEAALKSWLETRHVRENTLSGYRRSTELFAKLLGKDKNISDVNYDDVEKLFAVHWKDNSGRTKILYRGLLVRFFAWCIKRGYCQRNFAIEIEIQNEWSKEARRGRHDTGQALSREEALKLLNACKERRPYLWWFIFISLRTGLRRSNIIGDISKPPLSWSNVDLENGTLYIEGRFMKNGEVLNVPLHPELIHHLKILRATETDNIIVDIADVKKSWAGALKRAGLSEKGFRIHDLRHSFGTWLGEFCPHAVCQKLLGHVATNVTDIYTKHQTDETLREWLNKLPWLE